MTTTEINVEEAIKALKETMPGTYALIGELAAQPDIGKAIYGLVRRGLRGERSAFFAAEGGHCAGTERFNTVPRIYNRRGVMVFVGLKGI